LLGAEFGPPFAFHPFFKAIFKVTLCSKPTFQTMYQKAFLTFNFSLANGKNLSLSPNFFGKTTYMWLHKIHSSTSLSTIGDTKQ
jgi:hypothetical protein